MSRKDWLIQMLDADGAADGALLSARKREEYCNELIDLTLAAPRSQEPGEAQSATHGTRDIDQGAVLSGQSDSPTCTCGLRPHERANDYHAHGCPER